MVKIQCDLSSNRWLYIQQWCTRIRCFFVIVGAGALFIAGLIPNKWCKRAEGGLFALFDPDNVTIMVSLVAAARSITQLSGIDWESANMTYLYELI